METCGTPESALPRVESSRLERRQRAILDAAETLFLDQGYERTSLAEIVKLSRGSLATLYILFGNKQGLLHAIAARWRDEAVGASFECEPGDRRTGADILRKYARHRAEVMRSPRAIALMRILFSESLRDRAFAAQVYRDLHLPAVGEIAALLAELTADGRATIDNPEAAARLFLSLISGDSMVSLLVGVEGDALDHAQVDARLAPFFAYFRIA